jgi:hypothetical protein
MAALGAAFTKPKIGARPKRQVSPKKLQEKPAARYLRRGLPTTVDVKVTPRQEGAFPNRSRQVERQNDRRIETENRAAAADTARRLRRRELLNRQAEREKNGFYDGQPSVDNALAHTGAGRLQRVKRDDTGKRRAGNLVRIG